MRDVPDPLLLVIDLECTCSDSGTPVPSHVGPEEMEIIELGAVIATPAGEVLDRFGRIARPVERPILTDFCRGLTSIRQVDVDAAAMLDTVLRELSIWLIATMPRISAWASWGDFDRKQIERECRRKEAPSPIADLAHINLKGGFAKRRRSKQVGMAKALEIAGLPLIGQHHRALDDATNIARLIPHCMSLTAPNPTKGNHP
jgi:inhibitor of KinA sporulation pathway (predicted exonuclease)